MADPYQILGVRREAGADEIRKAYRGLAKKTHPDLHPDDKAAEVRFKEIASAYAIVGDEAKRALFDSGKIDGSGAELKPSPDREFYRQHAEAEPGVKYEQYWRGSENGQEDDLFAELFGRRTTVKMRGSDLSYTLAVTFLEAVNGAKKRVVMGDGKTLDLSIPPGLVDQQILRLRGQGQAGAGGEKPGDALVEIHVEPHPLFQRNGNDILSILAITLGEALAGAKVPAETVTGTINVTVPKGSNTGTKLRLRGKGVVARDAKGDHFVELKVVLPDKPDDAFVKSVKEWESMHPYDPR